MTINKSLFGKTPDGKEVYIFELITDSGMRAKVTNYGVTLTELKVPDKPGNLDDIVLGFNSLDEYMGNHPYFGCVVGRFGNRIGNAQFTIDDETYKLTANENGNTLHGGSGFNRVVWDVEEINNQDEIGLKFNYLSKDLEDGFPGNLKVEVTYLFTNQNEFKLLYLAETDKTTHVNLTHHSYFNLNGCKSDVLDHEVMIDSSEVTEVNDSLIPTGKILNIKGTALNLSQFKNLGKQVNALKEKGFDHNFISKDKSNNLKLIAKAFEPTSGRLMEVYTTEPAVQLYSGSYIGEITGKNNTQYKDFYGFCYETQHYPDSPNNPEFPCTLLKPGEKYESQTVYTFTVKNS